MKKEIQFYLLITFGILFWAVLTMGMIFYFNSQRPMIANQLSGIASLKNGKEKIQLLELAEAIDPSDERKLTISEELLEFGYNVEARSILNQAESTPIKTELLVYAEVSNGNYDNIATLSNPKSNLGKLLCATFNSDYDNSGDSELAKTMPRNNPIELANYLYLQKQYGLARYISLRENEKNLTKPSLKLIAKSYEATGDYQKAYDWSKELIKIDVSDKGSYEYSLGLAEILKSDIDINHLKLQLFTLNNLNK